MEEDTAKLTHGQLTESNREEKVSLIDFNRSSVPLVEIVTEPDFSEATEVKEYLQKLQQTVRYLSVSNADMDKGDMRLEPNISLSDNNPKDTHWTDAELPKYKVEVKNINSFRFVEKAINFEIERQKKILEKGETPLQETRGWNEIKNETVSQRLKEEANDYRYFPEPDIPPIHFTKEQISTLKSQVPELPEEKYSRFLYEFSLSDYDAEILTREKSAADYFEEAVKVGKGNNITPKQIANWIINKKPNIDEVLPATLVKQIVESTAVVTVDEEKLVAVIKDVLEKNQKAVEDYKKGHENVIMFLVGQVMRQMNQKVDPHGIKRLLTDIIKTKT